MFASCDPPRAARAGPLFAAFEARALLAGTLVSLPPATHRSWHVRGPLFAAFEAQALLAGKLVSLPPATHLSWHVRGRSWRHSRREPPLRGRSFLCLLRPTSHGMSGTDLCGIRDGACYRDWTGSTPARRTTPPRDWGVRGMRGGSRGGHAPCGAALFVCPRGMGDNLIVGGTGSAAGASRPSNGRSLATECTGEAMADRAWCVRGSRGACAHCGGDLLVCP